MITTAPISRWVTSWLFLFCCSQVSAQQSVKPITSLYGLELGMPRDHVLAGLAGHYKLTEPAKPSDPSNGVDIWQVFSGDRYAGDVWFKDGKLAYATVNLYYAEGEGGREPELVDRLFEALFDNCGQSKMTEDQHGLMTRSRSAMIRLEAVEEGSGNVRIHSLHFQMLQVPGDSGMRQFILSVMTGLHGSRTVMLDESMLKEWQGQTGQGTKEH